MKPLRIAALLALSFAFGGVATEVGLRARSAVRIANEQREVASAPHDLVAVRIGTEDGAIVSTQRLIVAPGRPAHFAVPDPLHPRRVLPLHVEAVRESSGRYAIAYALGLPGAPSRGMLELSPGVERPLDLGAVPLRAAVVALPVPSAAFDAWLAAERGRASAPTPRA